MYESYWQLDKRPFEHPVDARFHFPAESQRGALLKLRYVLENRRGAAESKMKFRPCVARERNPFRVSRQPR